MILILFVSGVILLNSYIQPNEVPSFWGWKPFIVLSGSMESEIITGDIAVVKEVDTKTLKVGDIIAFRESDDIVITHRIIGITEVEGETRYITKGDNNNIEDSGYVLPSQVEGIYQFRIGRLRKFSNVCTNPNRNGNMYIHSINNTSNTSNGR